MEKPKPSKGREGTPMNKMILTIKVVTTRNGTTAPEVRLNGKKVLAETLSIDWKEGVEPKIEIGLGCEEMKEEKICQQ